MLLFPACGDDDENIIPPPDATSYFPLEVGAYWIYETFNQDDNGEENVSSTDTLTVTNSYQDGEDIVYELSLSNNSLFEVFFPTSFRLSDGKLYGESGTLLLDVDASQSGQVVRSDTITQNLGYVDYRFLEEVNPIESPAGTFDCINFQGVVTSTDPDEAINGKPVNNYYAEGIGLVRANNYFWSNARLVGIRLISFELP